MADMMDTLKELLGDNAEEKISSVMSALGVSENKTDAPAPTLPISEASAAADSISPDMLLQAQKLLKQFSSAGNDQRTGLLMSLKPYMRKTRQSSIDNAVKMLNLARVLQLFDGKGSL